jgi:class 3 adenylate cyclase
VRVRWPLRRKLALGAAALAITVAATTGAVAVEIARRDVEASAVELWRAVHDDVARTLEATLGRAEDVVAAVATELVQGDVPEEARLRVALRLVESAQGVDHVALYDAAGALIDVVRDMDAEGVEVADVAPTDVVAMAERDGVGIGEASDHSGEARVLVLLPIRPAGMTTGFAGSYASLRPLQRRVEALAATYFAGQATGPFVVDGALRVLAHPDLERGRIPESMAGLSLFAAVRASEIRESALTIAHVPGSDGSPHICWARRIGGRDWIVVTEAPEARVYEGVHAMERSVLASVGVASAVALALALLFASRLTSPLRSLTGFASQLAARDFGARVHVESSDELGVLAQAMNRAAGELAEGQEKLLEQERVRADLARYLPGELVEKVARDPSALALGGKRMDVSVLFADVVAFTPLSESLPAERVVALLNDLFTILTEIVFRHGGIVDKFVGDSVMALFGVPATHSSHADRALSAAEDMLVWLETGAAALEERHGVRLRVAIGVHSGEAIVGNIGSERRMEYTAIGDVVNVAARLEAMARPQQILTTEATVLAAGAGHDSRDLGLREIPGRAGAVRLHEVLW